MLRVPKFLPRIARQASFAAPSNMSGASSIFRVSTNSAFYIILGAACFWYSSWFFSNIL